MPVTPTAGTDWFPPDLPFSSTTTTLSPTSANSVVLFFIRHTWNGLALFAILVLVKNTARALSACRGRNANSTNTASIPDTKLHWQFPPPFPDATHLQKTRRISAPAFFKSYQPRDYYFPPATPRPSWEMAGHAGGSSGDGHLSLQQHEAPTTGNEHPSLSAGSGNGGADTGGVSRRSHIMMRPPPPPPLTPPAPSQAAVFAPEHGALGASLIHQPNPDYLSPTASSSFLPEDSPPGPSRRSFSKALPLAIPAPPPLQARNSDSSASSDETHFSPRSFPSPTPFLPPPPPAFDENGKSMDVQGEVISVTDGFGAGWTRHTRVYGGGVCLACAASGGEGGFYGPTALRSEGI